MLRFLITDASIFCLKLFMYRYQKQKLTEFFQNEDPTLLSKALADMIESYKKLKENTSSSEKD